MIDNGETPVPGALCRSIGERVWDLRVEGFDNPEIAAELGIPAHKLFRTLNLARSERLIKTANWTTVNLCSLKMTYPLPTKPLISTKLCECGYIEPKHSVGCVLTSIQHEQTAVSGRPGPVR